MAAIASGSLRFHVWRARRGDGREYLLIDLGPAGRYEADLTLGQSSEAIGRGRPYASGKGITVWKTTRGAPGHERVCLNIKSHRFRGLFRAYLDHPQSPVHPRPKEGRTSCPPNPV